MHYPTDLAAAAAILLERRQSGKQGPRLPESCRPTDLNAALEIQSTVSTRLGDRIAAWKCGLPSDDRVIMAPIFSNTVQAVSPCRVQVRTGKVRAEPELAFILARDLPPRELPYTPSEIDASIAHTHLALELIDSRFSNETDAGFFEHLADCLFNQGLFIGPEVNTCLARAASDMTIRITTASGEAIELDGHHPNNDPRAPLYWLANYLRSNGRGLQAGQAVITGSYAGCIDLPPEENIAIEYGSLGILPVYFAQE